MPPSGADPPAAAPDPHSQVDHRAPQVEDDPARPRYAQVRPRQVALLLFPIER